MIYTVTLNPALDKTVEIAEFYVNQVNRITHLRTDPGGKGINVSKVLQKLGHRSVALALLAGDTGHQLAAMLEELGLTCDLTFVEGQTRTNLKIKDPANGTNTDLNEPGVPVGQEVLDAMLARLVDRLEQGDLVVLSGSVPPVAPADTYKTWITACKQAGARVFLDADGALLAEGIEARPFLLKPNQQELSRLTGCGQTVEGLKKAAQALLGGGTELVVVSMGGDGALFVTREAVIRAQGLKVPVGSTVGAGDSMVAALALALERGLCLEETVRLAMAVSAANVMCSGTQAAEWAQIQPLLEQVRFRVLA